MDNPLPPLIDLPEKLTFTKDGVWLHGGTPITHELTEALLSRLLHYSSEHQAYVVESQGRCIRVHVEDTPRVVRAFVGEKAPWEILLNDGKKSEFLPNTLMVSEANVFYCRGNTGEEYRILRPAMQALFPHITESAGNFQFEFGGRRYVIGRREDHVG